jgi:hypothetical protein
MRDAVPKDSVKDLRESVPLMKEWALLLAPAAVWAVEFQATYALVWYHCTQGGWIAGLVVLAVAAALTVALGALAAVAWRRAGESWPGPDGDPRTRTRFMSVLAVFNSALFTLLIVLQGFATLVFRPCD